MLIRSGQYSSNNCPMSNCYPCVVCEFMVSKLLAQTVTENYPDYTCTQSTSLLGSRGNRFDCVLTSLYFRDEDELPIINIRPPRNADLEVNVATVDPRYN